MVNFHRIFVGELMDNTRFKGFLYVTGMVCLGTLGVVLDYLGVPIGYIVLVISALVLPLGYGVYILGRQIGIIKSINGRKYRVIRAICAWKKVIGEPPTFPVLLKLAEYDDLSEEELHESLVGLEGDGFLKKVADDPLTYDVA